MNSKVIEINSRYEQLLRQVPVGVYVWRFNADGSMGFEYANSRFCEILGLVLEAVLDNYRLAFASVHPDDEDRLIRDNDQARITQAPFRWEGRFVLHDEIRWISISSDPTLLPDGGSVWHGVISDITDLKRSETQIHESEERYRTLITGIMEGVVLQDADGKVVSCNPSAERILGLANNEIAGRDATDPRWGEIREDGSVFPDEDNPALVALRTGLPQSNITMGLRRPDANLVWISINAQPLFKMSESKPYAVVVTFSDITERKRTEAALITREKEFRLLAESMPQIVWITLSDGLNIYFNQQWVDYTGMTMEESHGHGWNIPFHPDDQQRAWDAWKNAVNNRGNYELECRLLRKDGIYRWWLIRGVPVLDENGNIIKWFGTCTDIDHIKQADEELKLSSMVLQNSSEGMVVADENNLIIAVNPAFTAITGYSFEEVRGQNPKMLSSGRHNEAFYHDMWQSLNGIGYWQGEIWDKRKNGEIYAKFLTINTIRNAYGSVQRYVALFSDITEKKLSEEMIWKQANFDKLTGLPNRNMFHDRLEQEKKKSDRAGHPLALLLIDLDKFKEVNDTLGHDKGDMLLIEAAHRITACVRETDTVARLGGDEFTVILSEISDNSHLEDIAGKIIVRLLEPFHLDNDVAYVSASIGITLYPGDADSIDTLMKNADQAMYAAKNKGRNRFSYFTLSMQQAAQTRMHLSNDLRGALEAHQFQVYYQPIVELSSGKIFKAEALIRWLHPVRGLVPPMEFIPLAEEDGMIIPIGDWVFKQAVQQVRLWRSNYHKSFQISVNKSPVQMSHSDSGDTWPNYLEQQDVPGRAIAIEITEGLLLNADSAVNEKLLAFRDAGIKVAIDDFGTGYSSLSYLKKLDIDYIKIDQSFVHQLEEDVNDLALCEAIIVMSHKLGLKVVAEGVETEGQRDLLAAAGCDYAQGYLYSKPVPPEEFEMLLKN